MLIGYARVSTQDQTLDLQLDALKKAGCEKLYTDTASGAKAEREGLEEALDYAREGDILIVWRLDRLGRSLRHLIEAITLLRGGFHIHRRLRRPDHSACRADAHLWPFSRGKGDGGGSQDLGPDRDGDRALRRAERARAGASARRDGARAGHPAPVPARGHAVAEPAGDLGPGQRLDPAPPAPGPGGRATAAAGARPPWRGA